MKNFIYKTLLYKIIIMMVLVNLTTVLVTQSLTAQNATRNNLVNIDWLNKNLKNTNIVLLDASPAQIYTVKHIPGAINYDIFTYGVKELPLSEIEKRYQSWGISLGKKIIIYDQGGTNLATRLFFSLEYYGFPAKDIFVLDGGFSKWQEAGLSVSGEKTSEPMKGTFVIKTINKNVNASLPEFLNASGDLENNELIDALSPEWYYGSLNIFGRPGHIPNASLLPVEDFYNPDKTFKSKEELTKEMNFIGIDPNKNIYTYCGGGIAASVPYFALKYILGYKNVKLFTGSQLEWVSDMRELPLWTYDAPYLIRNASWLQAWSGKMMRMYGLSHLNIIDVRDSDIYMKEHIEYAINIPANLFKSYVNDPVNMAKVLNSAGIDALNEVIIVSGGGLTKDAAMAFVTLEKIGHKKISLFIESAEKWNESGLKILSDSDKDLKKEVMNDLNYKVQLNDNLFISDPTGTNRVFPNIYIASGNSMPTIMPDSKVIHIPYADLLTTIGTPKAAKEIWIILAKAGISRYTELICYSDDQSEAAVNYFLLKLMGFSHVKILSN